MFNACKTVRPLRQLLLALLATLLLPLSAAAQIVTCSATITTPITFSGFDVLSGAAVDTTATLTITCNGIVNAVDISVCPSIEAGSGGATGGVRQMQRVSGTELLSFGLFQDAARTIPWGSVNDATLGDPPLITVAVPAQFGTGMATRTIYARLFGGQTGIAPGTYQSNFGGAETDIRYGATLSLTDCAGPLTLLTQSTTAPFLVETTVDANCLLSVTQDVNFGVEGVLAADVNAAGELEVTCTAGTAYTVALDRQAGSLPLGSWEMTKGAEVVTYGLYTDASRTDLWGSLTDDLVSGSGTGAAQVLDVYGQVPAQTTPSAGVYTDTVVVTLSY